MPVASSATASPTRPSSMRETRAPARRPAASELRAACPERQRQRRAAGQGRSLPSRGRSRPAGRRPGRAPRRQAHNVASIASRFFVRLSAGVRLSFTTVSCAPSRCACRSCSACSASSVRCFSPRASSASICSATWPRPAALGVNSASSGSSGAQAAALVAPSSRSSAPVVSNRLRPREPQRPVVGLLLHLRRRHARLLVVGARDATAERRQPDDAVPGSRAESGCWGPLSFHLRRIHGLWLGLPPPGASRGSGLCRWLVVKAPRGGGRPYERRSRPAPVSPA